MRPLSICFLALALACASPPADSSAAPDPAPSNLASSCYTLHLAGTPAPDVNLPALIELSRDAAPHVVEPGPLAVREPGALEPRAPISWWVPRGDDAIDLVLGGGYTGYHFELKSAVGGDWVGLGTYFADFGRDPAPAQLPVRLKPSPCP